LKSRDFVETLCSNINQAELDHDFDLDLNNGNNGNNTITTMTTTESLPRPRQGGGTEIVGREEIGARDTPRLEPHGMFFSFFF
jgi:hypothetical protein